MHHKKYLNYKCKKLDEQWTLWIKIFFHTCWLRICNHANSHTLFQECAFSKKSIYFCFYKFLPELSQHYQRVLPLSVPMSNEVHTPESHMEQSFLKIRIVEWSQLSCFSISSLKLHNIHVYPNENNIFELLINLFCTITFHQ